jgi:FkbM family methyltransferase
VNRESRTYSGLVRLRDAGFKPKGILDIGAYSGIWSRGVRTIFAEAYVLMIEALAERENELRTACAEIGNAEYQISLLGGSNDGQASFFVVHAGPDKSQRTGSSKYKENTRFPTEERQLAQRSLNSILSQAQQPFDLIKLDVQGAEVEILQGGTEYLHRTEAILMEVATLPYNDGAPLVDRVLVEMKKLGFVLYDLLDEIRTGRGCLFQFDALFIRPDSPYRPRPPY